MTRALGGALPGGLKQTRVTAGYWDGRGRNSGLTESRREKTE